MKAKAFEILTGPQLTGVENSPILIQRVATIDMTLAGEVFSADFLVASGFITQAILGLDFLQETKCVINTEQGVLQIKGKAMPLLEGTNQQHCALVSTVKAQETIEISPFSEMEMCAITPDTINNSIDWLLEALPHRDTTMVATAVVSLLQSQFEQPIYQERVSLYIRVLLLK